MKDTIKDASTKSLKSEKVDQNSSNFKFVLELTWILIICSAVMYGFSGNKTENSVLCFDDQSVKTKFAAQLGVERGIDPFSTPQFIQYSTSIDSIVKFMADGKSVVQCSSCVSNCKDITSNVVDIYNTKKKG